MVLMKEMGSGRGGSVGSGVLMDDDVNGGRSSSCPSRSGLISSTSDERAGDDVAPLLLSVDGAREAALRSRIAV